MPTAASSSSLVLPAVRRAAEPPGGLLIWLVVALEVFTFGAGLVVFVVLAAREPDVFRAGRSSLHQTIAWINTLILVTGGGFMANGLGCLQAGRRKVATRWMLGAILSAAGFLTLKGVEYADKLAHGRGLSADTFYTLYWLLTGFHCLHVLTALVMMILVTAGVARGASSTVQSDADTCGIFWHLCDLIWLILYPVLYLLP